MKLETILVPLDGSEYARAAVPVARTLAEMLGATLDVVHVGEDTAPIEELLQGVSIPPGTLRQLVLHRTPGRPDEELLRIANERPGALIVMCTHTGVEKPRGALGSVAEEVLCHAACPLVLVQPERGLRPWTLCRLLLPEDGTPATAAAMDPAGELAERSGADVLVLHVAAPRGAQPAEPGTLTAPQYLDQPQHEWPTWASEFLERMTALGHPPAAVRFLLAMAIGDPGDEIVRFARQHAIDLVVLAWHGRWEPAVATTMKAVIRDAGSPVFIRRVEPASPDQ